MFIKWSDLASESLLEITAYYEEVAGHVVADRAENSILSQVEKIKDFPLSIEVSKEYPGTRRLVMKVFPYYAFLRVGEDSIEVVDVVHSSRKLPKNSEHN
jgi:plasmid stabilization system protein ParE